MTGEYGVAGAGHGVIDSRGSVSRCRGDFWPGCVVRDIEDLVVMAAKCVDAGAALHIPYFARSIDGSRDTDVGGVVELAAGDLPLVAR